MTRKLTLRGKHLATLRVTFMGSYSGYFVRKVEQMLAGGYTAEELLSVAVSET